MRFQVGKIYTRGGDGGCTRLGDNREVNKDHPRLDALGTVDELNSTLGLILAEPIPDPPRELLMQIQHDLFDLGEELCLPGYQVIGSPHTTWMEERLDELNEHLPPLRDFILPGGTRAAAAAHLARTICRRAERQVAGLARDEWVSPEASKYLNRLSDLLFVVARSLNRADGNTDVLRKRRASK
jgi:cob(I)alamin adenosyltransferase